jgi:DNA-binding SARP family transcriptional activator
MIALAKQENLWVDADAFEDAASTAHKCQDPG